MKLVISVTGQMGAGKMSFANGVLLDWLDRSDGLLFTNYKPPDIERYGYNLADRLRPIGEIGEKGAVKRAPSDLYFRATRSR